jgi:hypothetical protein
LYCPLNSDPSPHGLGNLLAAILILVNGRLP